jgi:hypothetical protein
MKKILFVFLVIFVVIFAFISRIFAADNVQTVPFHFPSITQKLDNGIMFKSVLIGVSRQMSIESSGTTYQVVWGVEGYSLAGIPVCGLYTHVGWTGDGHYLTTPYWVYHSSWQIIPNNVDQISDQWLYYNAGYCGTGESITQGRIGIGTYGIDLYYYTKILHTTVYWYGNWWPYVE